MYTIIISLKGNFPAITFLITARHKTPCFDKIESNGKVVPFNIREKRMLCFCYTFGKNEMLEMGLNTVLKIQVDLFFIHIYKLHVMNAKECLIISERVSVTD